MEASKLKDPKGCHFASIDAFLGASGKPSSFPLVVLLDDRCHGAHDYDRDVTYITGPMTHEAPNLEPNSHDRMPIPFWLAMMGFGGQDPNERQRGFSVVPIDTVATWIDRLGDSKFRGWDLDVPQEDQPRNVKTKRIAIVSVPSDARVFGRFHCAVVDRLIVHQIVSIDEYHVPSEWNDTCLKTDVNMRRFVKTEDMTEALALQIAETRPVRYGRYKKVDTTLKDIPEQSLVICKAFVMRNTSTDREHFPSTNFPHCKFFDQELCTYAVSLYRDRDNNIVKGDPALINWVPKEYLTDDLIDAALGTPGTPHAFTKEEVARTSGDCWSGGTYVVRSIARALGCLTAEQQTPERVAWVLSLRDGGTDFIGQIKVPLSEAQWRRALEMDGCTLEHLPAQFRTHEMLKISLQHPTQEHCNGGVRAYNLKFATADEQEKYPDLVAQALESWSDSFRYRINPTDEECIRAGIKGFRDWEKVGVTVTPLIQEAMNFFNEHVLPTRPQPSGNCSGSRICDVEIVWDPEGDKRKKEEEERKARELDAKCEAKIQDLLDRLVAAPVA
jgi:hypothetical protein